MKTEHIENVKKNMQDHLVDGQIIRVTKQSRQAATASAQALGLTELEHAEIMIHITTTTSETK